MSDLKLNLAQLLIDNFKGITRSKADNMAIAIMAFVNADRDRQSDYCAPPSTGECSCRKFSAAPANCERRTQPEATAPAQDLSAAILAIDIPSKCLTHQASVYGFEEGLKAAAALASSANALSAGDSLTPDQIDDLVFGYAPSCPIGEGRALVTAILQSQKGGGHG